MNGMFDQSCAGDLDNCDPLVFIAISPGAHRHSAFLPRAAADHKRGLSLSVRLRRPRRNARSAVGQWNARLGRRLGALRWCRLMIDSLQRRIEAGPSGSATRPYVRCGSHGRRIVQRACAHHGELRPRGRVGKELTSASWAKAMPNFVATRRGPHEFACLP